MVGFPEKQTLRWRCACISIYWVVSSGTIFIRDWERQDWAEGENERQHRCSWSLSRSQGRRNGDDPADFFRVEAEALPLYVHIDQLLDQAEPRRERKNSAKRAKELPSKRAVPISNQHSSSWRNEYLDSGWYTIASTGQCSRKFVSALGIWLNPNWKKKKSLEVKGAAQWYRTCLRFEVR